MMISTKEHHDLMAAFERDHRGYRLDREAKSFWPKGNVYQNGETNALFLAYRNGASFAKAYHRDDSSTPANPAQVTDAIERVARMSFGYELMFEAICHIAGTSGGSTSWYTHKAQEITARVSPLHSLTADSNPGKPGDCKSQHRDFMRDFRAAIGAGGQAVAEDAETLKARAASVLCEAGALCGWPAPNCNAREGAEALFKAGLLSQPHPADERVVEAWRPIKTAPKDGTKILYRNRFKEIGFCHWDTGINDDEYPCWWDAEADDEVCPVIWLPVDTLPAFPDAIIKEGR